MVIGLIRCNVALLWASHAESFFDFIDNRRIGGTNACGPGADDRPVGTDQIFVKVPTRSPGLAEF